MKLGAGLQPFRQVWRDWLDLLRYAPPVLALAFAGELTQHIAEISMGMFASRDAFVALQGSALRMGFGLTKVAALLVAVAWGARWLAHRNSAERPELDGPIDWSRLLLPTAFSLAAMIAVVFVPIGSRSIRLILIVAVLLAGMPWSRMAMDALFGRPRESLRQALRGRPMPPIGGLLAILPVAAAMYLHMHNHNWAFGAQPLTVWALMAWDALLIAGLTGWLGALAYRFYQPAAA